MEDFWGKGLKEVRGETKSALPVVYASETRKSFGELRGYEESEGSVGVGNRAEEKGSAREEATAPFHHKGWIVLQWGSYRYLRH
jgi:hypothetical protein